MSRRQRPVDPGKAGKRPESERADRERGERPLVRELVEFETDREGTAGEGLGESGTLPDSVGGTTGNTDRAAGPRAPGATIPAVPGIDPAEARRLVGRFRRSEAELAAEDPATEPPERASSLEEAYPEEADTED